MTDAISHKQTLAQMISGYWSTQAIYVAAELGIADLLAEYPQTAAELAARTGTHGEALYRVLRALASVGIFAEDAESRFSLTSLAEYLRSDVPDSSREFAIMAGSEMYASWGGLLGAVETGEAAFDKTFGMPVFHYLTERHDRGRVFDAAMTSVHGRETGAMLDAYDFSPFETVVDVGGGAGLMLAGILERHPTMKGVLFDMPAVADRARATLSAAGVAERCRIAQGDFFTSVPEGGQVYVLRHILHDWDDGAAVAILRNCRQAMGPAGRVLVVESVIPPGNEPSFGKWLDLMMLIVGGRERTHAQYERIFGDAGLRLTRAVPTAAEVSVLEGVSAA